MPAINRPLSTSTEASWRDPAPLSEDVDVRAPPNDPLHSPPHKSARHPEDEKKVNSKMSDGRNLPARYVCHVCGVCIATGDGHKGDEAEVHVFNNLHASVANDKASKTIACPCCESA